MSAPPKQYGTSPPISVAPPKKDEIDRNSDLIEVLKSENCFEGADESNTRIKVLSTLQSLAEDFVKRATRSHGLPENLIQSAGGKIFTFGSYRLGAYGPGSDIDTLLVGPKHVTRQDFFTHVPSMLKELNPPAEDITAVPDSFMPIIKFELQSVSIDLLFAKIPSVSSVPKDMKLDNRDILRGCDDVNVRGLNGVRLTDELLGLVPSPTVFRLALRTIKLWAKRRGVYGNVYGFPGGITWAMLVAKICQLYPNAVSAVVVWKFFVIYTKWSWPQPVLLKPLEEGTVQGLRIWNPKIYHSDRQHLMPVITPNYPSMCSTHNVSKSTKLVILREMERGNQILTEIMGQKKPWSALFEKHSFFTNDYKYYLSVLASSKTAEEQLKWSGAVESKLRHLVLKLEQLDTIKLAHPFVKKFDKSHICDNEDEATKLSHGEYLVSQTSAVKTSDADLTNQASAKEENSEGKSKVWTTTFYVGLVLDTNGGSKQVDISWPTQEFYEICKTWQPYSEDMHGIHVGLARDYQLPEDVFGAGEAKPTKPVRKIKVVKRRLEQDEADATGKRQRVDPTSTPAAPSSGVPAY